MSTFWFTSIIVLAVGLCTLAFSLKEKSEWKWKDFSREVGIACIIAALVTITYELHARSQYDKENIESVLHAVMGEIIPHEVWEEVKSAVIQRSLIRTDFQLRMKVSRDSELPSHQAILTLEVIYNLHGLQPKEWVAVVTQTLSSDLSCPNKDLPRFDQIIVGEKELALTELIADNGSIPVPIPLKPRNKPPTRVMSKRQEVINVPGSYNFSMTEITQGFSLEIDEWPPDIEPYVLVISDKANDRLKHLGNHYYFDGILLPGQSIRIGFKQLDKRGSQNSSGPSQ